MIGWLLVLLGGIVLVSVQTRSGDRGREREREG